ncbi:hypothetical protein ATO49_12155 [Mycolicibacterium fortuitum subsp. fortuitum DSM 46621 = ATCC 6841 = JCM 6387]|nr:hypothetical protein ATO49_12155 [Mycolicibacterium fortuitum subsp. fortuitum DSM 46621 = ATCC 6841 = JCM 6387]
MDDVKRVVEYPYFLRHLLVVGAVLCALGFPWALYAVVVREQGPDPIVTIVFVVALATVLVGARLMPPHPDAAILRPGGAWRSAV